MPEYIKRVPKKGRKKAAKKSQPASRSTTSRKAISPTGSRVPSASQSQPMRMSAKRQEKLIAVAVTLFEATISTSVVHAAADQAADYAGGGIWTALTSEWSGSNCRAMARFARELLDGNDWLHRHVGNLIGWVLKSLGAHRIVYRFGKEIARQFIPLPWDHQVKIVARGMQAAGIAVCILSGRRLYECDCFIDVVLVEGKEQAKQLILHAADDWTRLVELSIEK